MAAVTATMITRRSIAASFEIDRRSPGARTSKARRATDARDQHAVPFRDVGAGMRGIGGRILDAETRNDGVEIPGRVFDRHVGAKTSNHSEKSEIACRASRVGGNWKAARQDLPREQDRQRRAAERRRRYSLAVQYEWRSQHIRVAAEPTFPQAVTQYDHGFPGATLVLRDKGSAECSGGAECREQA